jgi:kynurenine formamidase
MHRLNARDAPIASLPCVSHSLSCVAAPDAAIREEGHLILNHPLPGWDDRIMRLVDLSHVIEHQMITYPGLPGPEIGEHLSFDASASHYAPGTEFAIGRVSMVANTGTYLDTPAHRFRNGHDLAGLPLESCALLRAVVVDGGDGPIGPSAFSDVEVKGAAVLLRTGWDRHWGTDRYGDPRPSSPHRSRRTHARRPRRRPGRD